LPPELITPLRGDDFPVPPRRKAPTTRRFARGSMARRVLLIVLLATLLVAGLLAHRLWDFGSAISTQNPLSTQTRYMTAGDRINLLILGYGGGAHNGPNLTDSMIVVSINLQDNATTMISVPRDLWVQVPPESGNYAKLNSAYENGLANGYNGISASPAAGGAEAARKVSDVTGMPVQYWLTLNFNGFRGLVDALGGVDVNVPVGWTAINLGGDGLPGTGTATFKAGLQHMDGERALQYARARYITSPASEGSDFARSRRQLLLIHAIIDRARSLGAVPELPGVMNALQQALYTNLSFADLTLLATNVDINHAALIGLTNDNVLVDAVSDDGQDILEPANGDWGVVQKYINAHLKK
ncbi:MAG TPA: LCP family protein, partial [Ktedonobacterales bacterium]|nr:LCP family protein [Ktedonobacterales bacterium]